MLRKFAIFFITFGLSFLVQEWGCLPQAKAFMWLNIGANVLVLAIAIIACLIAGKSLGEKLGYSIGLAIFYAISLAIVMLATWGATKLFTVDFFVAFQIMTFGQCLCYNPRKNRD